MEKKRHQAGAIVLFDGVCHFCNGAVQFIIQHDRRGYFRFASLQSDTGKSLLAGRPDLQNLDSIVLAEGGRFYTESTAVLRIAGKLDGLWKAFGLLIVFPPALRNPVYRWFARRRYRWFGKARTCMIPAPEIRDRFLDLG